MRADGTVRARMPVLPDLLGAGDALSIGAVAPMCDLMAGSLAARAVAPDWVATLDFKLLFPGRLREGSVQGACRPLRVGRNTVLSESRLSDANGRPVGGAWVTFTRLPRREENPSPDHELGWTRYRSEEEEPRIPFDEYLGLRFDTEAAEIELDHHERIYNSFGSIQGGAMGSLLARVATLAGERHLGAPARTVDLHFSYTAQARVGPFRLDAEVLDASPTGVQCRVELIDSGQDNRLAAIGTARAVPVD